MIGLTVVLDPESEVTQAEVKNNNAVGILRKKLLCDLNEELVDSEESINKGKTEEDWSEIAERRGSWSILRDNSLKLLEYSTMFVFQHNKSWYRCYCCQEMYPNLELLGEHTENEHTRHDLEKKIINTQNRSLKVEISMLKCKICEKKCESLPDVRQHLQNAHDMKFGQNGQDLLVPFKIQTEGLRCQICGETFRNFRLLNMHMNKHSPNHICDVCGAGFANLVFLNLHRTRSHKKIRCEECDINFESRPDKKRHDIAEHNLKFVSKARFPCPYCDERFTQENYKMQHLVDKHGMVKPEHKCHFCTKVFITRALMNNHIKNVHKKERRHECDLCLDAFYTKSDVMRHRVTHTGEKKFSCSLCNCPFATKDSLRRHMKRNACRS